MSVPMAYPTLGSAREVSWPVRTATRVRKAAVVVGVVVRYGDREYGDREYGEHGEHGEHGSGEYGPGEYGSRQYGTR